MCKLFSCSDSYSSSFVSSLGPSWEQTEADGVGVATAAFCWRFQAFPLVGVV